MKREWIYASIGLFFWAVFYIMFLVSTSGIKEAFSAFSTESLLSQIFILFIPGLIIATLFYDIGAIKNAKLRKKSLLISSVIIFLFLIIFRLVYL